MLAYQKITNGQGENIGVRHVAHVGMSANGDHENAITHDPDNEDARKYYRNDVGFESLVVGNVFLLYAVLVWNARVDAAVVDAARWYAGRCHHHHHRAIRKGCVHFFRKTFFLFHSCSLFFLIYVEFFLLR